MAGPCTVAELRQASGAANAPAVVYRLRHKFSVEIECKRVPSVDRDGLSITMGRYELTDEGRQVAAGLVGW